MTCGWNQADDDDFDWIRQRGDTASYGTGPGVDATYGTDQGHYMYVEASWPRQKGDVTKLRSPNFPMSGYGCQMQIAYHMRGYHIGTLAVEVQAEGGKEVMFQRVGEQPDGWQRANISIGGLSNFNITIWGVVGDGYAGDIAIDDLALVNCEPPYWEYVQIVEPPVSLLLEITNTYA